MDIIFDGRNKEYGAYQLRKTYSGRLLTGLAVMIGAVLLVFIGSVIANAKKDAKTEILVQDVNLADVKQQEEPKPEPPPPPPPPKVEPPKIEITKFTPPKIVKDEEVKPEDEIKQQDELDNTTIGKINQEGIKTDVVAPPVEEKGTGTVEAPKVEEDYDKEFKTVQIEAKFPGGLGEWKRFLERNLNRDVPIDNGAPVGNYTVVVSFLVDKDGNVSEVRAENNPGYGTAEEAVRVIKRGPKWTPAVQNGRNVIYRQKQTITFQVSEE
ncbi:MAG: energy transducer TonB [Chitinophagaceae bacterium]